jgi:hypothetical protein
MNRSGEGSPNSSNSEPELDFERADFGEASGPMLCALCQIPISDKYFTVGSAMVCNRCEGLHRNAGPPGSPFSRLAGAIGLGCVAAVIGSALWMAVTKMTGYEIGLIAIAIGWIVATAVQFGNRGTGGVPYQILAIFLTYTAIVMTYVPMLMAQIDPQSKANVGAQIEQQASESTLGAEAPVLTPEAETLIALMIAIPIAYTVPFLAGFGNLIGIVIIGFALYQAWRMTAKRELVWAGPFQLGAASDR